MSQYQHYVPRFYLRHFSSDKDHKNINLFNLTRQQVFNGPIAKQCGKPFFYCQEKKVEQAFQKIEEKAACILRKIVNTEKLCINCEEYVLLLSYILWQSGRTNKAGEGMLKYINDIFDYLKPDLATTKEATRLGVTLDDLKDAEISCRYPALETSYWALTRAPLIFDMQLVLLINESRIEFITSDAPIILFNEFFNSKTKGSQTGYANRGLQIFFPISPKYMLVLYDPEYYTIPFTENLTYAIKKNKDVRRLNGLQIIFGQKNVYFRNYSEADLKQQYSELKSKRVEETIVESLGTRPKGEYISELIHFAKDCPNYDLSKLSFIRIYSDAVDEPGIRNQSLLDEHNERMKKMYPQMEKGCGNTIRSK